MSGVNPTAGTRETKADARREQLAQSALTTLGELGYAKTSLREIAQNSPFSHGVLHYCDQLELVVEVTQAMFEPELRQAVLEIDKSLEVMIWQVVSRFAELSDAAPTLDSATTYALLDGVFEKALLEHLTGTGTALPTLHQRAFNLLPSLITP